MVLGLVLYVVLYHQGWLAVISVLGESSWGSCLAGLRLILWGTKEPVYEV